MTTPEESHTPEIGSHVKWTTPNGSVVEGTIEGWRRSRSQMVCEDGTWPGIQFLIDDGSKTVWTCTFADRVRQ